MKRPGSRLYPFLTVCLVISVAFNAWQLARGRGGAQPTDRSSPGERGSMTRGNSGFSQNGARAEIQAYRESVSGDPELLLRRIFAANPHSPHQDAKFISALKFLANRNPTAALDFVTGMMEGLPRSESLAIVIGAWAARDPQAAADWISADNSGTRKDEATHGLILEWGNSDPVKAAAWVGNLPETGLRVSNAELLAEIWASRDGPAALAWSSKMAAADEHAGAVLHIVLDTWAEGAPREAAKEIARISDSDTAVEASRIVAGIWARVSPEDASRWADGLSDEAMRHQAKIAIAEAWADSQPSLVAERILVEADPELQVDQTSALLSRWVASDAEAAAKWVAQLPPGSAKDRAILEMASGLADSNPAAAMPWALALTHPREQKEQVEAVLAEWLEQDSVAASKWLESASLPAALEHVRSPNRRNSDQ